MTEMEKILKGNYQVHAVGSYNSDVMDTFGNGVKAGEDIDNFTLVEIVYDPATGEETCVQLTNVANEGLLACTPETRHFEFERMDSFFNGKDEYVRCAYLAPNKRFQTSAFVKDNEGKEIIKGQKAHFDPASKKFIISNDDTEHADFANAFNKFVVQEVEVDTEFTGIDVVMFRAVAK